MADSRLAQRRQDRGLTQEELARRVGISRSVYWRIETGRYPNGNIPLRYLVNLAIILDCRLRDLLEDEWFEWLLLDQREHRLVGYRARL